MKYLGLSLCRKKHRFWSQNAQLRVCGMDVVIPSLWDPKGATTMCDAPSTQVPSKLPPGFVWVPIYQGNEITLS